MKLLSLLCLVALVSVGGCASPADDDAGDGREALRGVPDDPSVHEANTKTTTFVSAMDFAYLDAKASDFVQVAGGDLVGDARTTFTSATRSCGERGPRVNAWTWTANVPASPGDLTPAPRRLLVVATIARPGKPMGIAVHDARGAFVWGRRYYDWQDDYEPSIDPAVVAAIRGCFW